MGMVRLVLLALLLNGCGFVKQIWGEAPPARKTVVMQGEALPSFENIFGDNRALADTTLILWKQNIVNSFNQIEGKKKDFLSADEAALLVRTGFVKLSSDTELSVKRARAILTLLGFKDGISLNDVQSLFTWLDQNREQTKTFYRMFIAENLTNDAWQSKDLVSLLQLFGSLIELGGDESMTPKQMANLIEPWVPENFTHARDSLESGLEFGVSFFASFCGDRVDSVNWNGKKIGICIRQAVDHFTATAPVFDFIFGNLNPFKSGRELKAANDALVSSMRSWLKDHHHPLFQTIRVSNLAKQLSIPPPYQFFQLTEWLPKLNSESTAEAFSPTFFIDLAQMVETWVGTFQRVTAKERCAAEEWRTCEFSGDYAPVDELYNAEYATLIRSKNLNFVDQIAFYDSVSSFLMAKLDTDQDGYLSNNIKDLIGIAIRLMDSNAFAYNVVQRIQEKPIDPSSTEESLKSIKRQGLAELAAFASDLIPSRSVDKRSFIKKMRSQIYAKEKNLGYSLDQLGLTAFLYVYDIIGSLRSDYLANYDLPTTKEGSVVRVKRKKVIEALPRILYDHFPRIYNECTQWGFERTCGVVFSEVLPSPGPGLDTIETYEMDVITLTSVLLESMMNRCDRNHDDFLSSNIFDGFDEKHCMINVSQALAQRLMNANIVEQDDKADLLMMLVRRVPFVRWVGKVALSRGSIQGIGVRVLPPFSLFSGSASLGSVMSLAAEFMNADKVKAIEGGVVGPSKNPGDELLYSNQITLGFLPSTEPAFRKSRR
jgi:hypothetical protein